jgi:hypothetical protein
MPRVSRVTLKGLASRRVPRLRLDPIRGGGRLAAVWLAKLPAAPNRPSYSLSPRSAKGLMPRSLLRTTRRKTSTKPPLELFSRDFLRRLVGSLFEPPSDAFDRPQREPDDYEREVAGHG